MNKLIIKRLIIAGCLVLLAAALGAWIGHLSVTDRYTAPSEVVVEPPVPLPEDPETPVPDAESPPLFFYAGDIQGANQAVALEEIALAAAAGVHRYVLPIDFPWEPVEQDAVLELMRQVIALDEQATCILALPMTPPAAWQTAHADHYLPGDSPLGNPASTAWLDTLTEGTTRLLARIRAEIDLNDRCQGVLLGDLAGISWNWQEALDASPVTLDAFKEWLERRYATEEALQTAWEQPEITFATVEWPTLQEDIPAGISFLLKAGAPQRDRKAFRAECLANALARLAQAIKANFTDDPPEIWAVYGHSLENGVRSAGHEGLGLLLESDVDAFLGPIAQLHRGLGSSGLPAVPINTLQVHGKQWYLIDDTRTGMTKDAATGQIQRIEGLRDLDVIHVQRRNFNLAATQGAGIVWVDPGDGRLAEAAYWNNFQQCQALYRSILNRPEADSAMEETMALPMEEEIVVAETVEADFVPEMEGVAELAEEAAEAAAEAAETPEEEDLLSLTVTPVREQRMVVVIDEESRWQLNAGSTFDRVLMQQACDALLRSGMRTEFYLLQDVLDERSPSASVYLFLNTFELTDEECERLHNRLADENACALWCYAPGYFAALKSVDHVSRTTGMQCQPLPASGRTGSTFALDGQWMRQDESFGESHPVQPLFSIEDDQADVLSRYREGDHVSIAMRVQDTGWTSVFIADPTWTPAVLREILRIVEQHVYVQPGNARHCDTLHIGDRLVGIHVGQSGDRQFTLGYYYDISDLYDPAIGWLQKEQFLLPMKMGETRLLSLESF